MTKEQIVEHLKLKAEGFDIQAEKHAKKKSYHLANINRVKAVLMRQLIVEFRMMHDRSNN